MGYRVEYTPSGAKHFGCRGKSRRLPLLTAAFFLIFLLLVSAFWPRGMQVLRELLIPGDSEATLAAWETLTGELRAGENVGNAVGSFCREIFRNAGLLPG